MIDLGSIAKGYIGDKILDIMENHGLKKGLVNMREDMVIFGEITLDVHIQHPRDKEKVIHSFKIKNSAVATSGDYAQYSKSFDESHILGKKDKGVVKKYLEKITGPSRDQITRLIGKQRKTDNQIAEEIQNTRYKLFNRILPAYSSQ